MTPDEWFDLLRTQLPGTAPTPRDDEVDALLDLARVAAHTSERWSAPISTYLAGVAMADLEPAERAQRLRAIADHLEAQAQS